MSSEVKRYDAVHIRFEDNNKCRCGWRSQFPADFIAEYKAKWHATQEQPK